MRAYRTKEDVPWRDILTILRWYLDMKTSNIRHAMKWGGVEAAKIELSDLRAGYDGLRGLRRFLGYGGETRCEWAARELLRICSKKRMAFSAIRCFHACSPNFSLSRLICF